MSQLAIFDIDGTLTDTTAIDDDCYRQAVAEAFGVAPETIDWADAEHVTDSGIFSWLSTAYGRPLPAAYEIAHTRSHFVELLRAAHQHDPHSITEIAGAAAALHAIQAAGWRIAVATGGWGPSAWLKLRAAKLVIDEAVFACSDDAITRTEIVQLAQRRAEQFHESEFDRVVTVGDGRWDLQAAADLGLPFIGIGSGARAAELRAGGASIVLPDYKDLDAVFHALATAAAPSPK